VHEDVVVVLVVPVDDDVVARAFGLVLHGLDEPASGSDHRGAFGCGQVVALVAVADPLGAEAGAFAAPVEGAEEREGVVGELDVRDAAGRGRAPKAAAGDVEEVCALGAASGGSGP
jgi:hypothetical protein